MSDAPFRSQRKGLTRFAPSAAGAVWQTRMSTPLELLAIHSLLSTLRICVNTSCMLYVILLD